MGTEILIANILSQTALLAVAIFFFKRWMDRVDETLKETAKQLQNNAVALATQLESVHIELKLANGRTAKLEGKVEVQKAICMERHTKDI
jgi:hypothetical protein